MSTVNSIEMRVNLRKNNNEKSDNFGKLYAELDRKRTLSLRGLAKHTRDIVEGVLTKLCQCVPELLAQGVPVKLDGLGTFYPTAKNKSGGLANVEEAKNTNPETLVEGVRVRFLPDGSQLDNITSREMKKNCSLRLNDVQVLSGTKTTTVNGKHKKVNIYAYVPIGQPEADPVTP